MQARDLSNFNPRLPLATAVKTALKLDLANSAEAFIIEAEKTGSLPGLHATAEARGLPASDPARDWSKGPVEVFKSKLFGAFERYCDRRREKYPPRAEEFGRTLKARIPAKTDTKPRINWPDGDTRQGTAHKLPDLGACRDAIRMKLPGIEFDA
jgi:hypothetical protein